MLKGFRDLKITTLTQVYTSFKFYNDKVLTFQSWDWVFLSDNRKRDRNGVEAPFETLMLKEIYSKEKTNDVQLLQLILEELQIIRQTLDPDTLKAKTAQIYWLGIAKCINRVFFVVYLISVSLFLVFIFREWKAE